MVSEIRGPQITRISFILVLGIPILTSHCFHGHEGVCFYGHTCSSRRYVTMQLGDMLLPTVTWLYNIALTAQNHVRISDSPHQKLLRYMISISCD